jgi:hypothetical protein
VTLATNVFEPEVANSVMMVQLKTCGVPVTVHPGVVVDQLMPAWLGRGSLIVTLNAEPGPPFVTVMSKPISLPALTGPTGSATFTTESAGGTMALG